MALIGFRAIPDTNLVVNICRNQELSEFSNGLLRAPDNYTTGAAKAVQSPPRSSIKGRFRSLEHTKVGVSKENFASLVGGQRGQILSTHVALDDRLTHRTKKNMRQLTISEL